MGWLAVLIVAFVVGRLLIALEPPHDQRDYYSPYWPDGTYKARPTPEAKERT